MPKTIQEIKDTLVDTPFPRQVTLELTAHCNLKCTMCPHPNLRRRKGFMSDELYRRCIDEICAEAKDTEVWLADHGESLILGNAIVEKVEYAKSRGLSKVFLNSNGILLTRSISKGFVAAGLDRVVFGIDGATSETYARIRVGGDLNTVISNIEQLLEEKARARKTPPEIWVQFIEMDENEHERDAFVEFWRNRDVGVKIRRKLSWGACIESRSVESLNEERIPCQWLMNLMHVLWDGRVGRCSGDHECDYSAGNVRTSSIAKIWQGPLKKERESQLSGQFDNLIDPCRRCIDWKVGIAEKLCPIGTRFSPSGKDRIPVEEYSLDGHPGP
jgi:MoaA/NifB/PqqE/SkfB family radical SAM enzyme